MGRVLLALTNEPADHKAFKSGAIGEEKVAARLAELCDAALFLYNRRLGSDRRDGDIDLIAIVAAGVFVVDAKRYVDKEVRVRRSGGLLSPVREQLFIGGRDKTSLFDSVTRQVTAVRAALADLSVGVVALVQPVLCFVDSQLPLSGSLSIAGVPIRGPKGTAKMLNSGGPLDETRRRALFEHLAQQLPPV